MPGEEDVKPVRPRLQRSLGNQADRSDEFAGLGWPAQVRLELRPRSRIVEELLEPLRGGRGRRIRPKIHVALSDAAAVWMQRPVRKLGGVCYRTMQLAKRGFRRIVVDANDESPCSHVVL